MTPAFDAACSRALDAGLTPERLRERLEAAIASHPEWTLRKMADGIGPLDWQECAVSTYAIGYVGPERWAIHLGREQEAICIVTLGESRAGGRTFARVPLPTADRAAIIAWLLHPPKIGRFAAADLWERLAGP